MTIQHEPWGGLAIMWADGRLTILIDVHDAWAAWDGRLVWRVPVGLA
jgi:hypothetical protein